MTARHYKTFYILDLDRTLYDTDGGAELLMRAAGEFEPTLEQGLRAHLKELMAQKAWFSMYDFIRSHGGAEATGQIKQAFLAHTKEEQLLLPGARELLAFIRQSGAGLGILTYGSPEVQSMKLMATKLDRQPHIITDRTEKGELIAEWRQDGQFVLPPEYGGGTADTVVFVDDRDFSFTGFPTEGARGYWLVDLDTRAEANTPTSVKAVSSLREVLTIESELTKA